MIEKSLDGWFSQDEIMKILGLKQTTLWKLRSKGKLKFSRPGKKIFYDGKSINMLLEENSTGTCTIDKLIHGK